jgi:nucleoside-diphosphate-sugar epimerase
MSGALLVTGGSGFIGGAVLPLLQQAAPAREIWLASRRPTGALPAAGRHVPLDLAAPCIELPPGVHTVLHLAGEKRDVAQMAAVNHDGAVRLVRAAAKAGAQRFVHLSSVGVYGAPRHAGLVDEDFMHTPRGPYETSKDGGERAVRECCAALGLQCVVMQPSNVVGVVPGRSMPLLGLARMVAKGWFRFFGHRPAWVNYVAVEDVAAALVAAALHSDAEGVFIVNTPAPLARLVGWMADELGLPAPTARLPYAVGASAAAAGALARLVLRREMPFSPERFAELTNTTRFDGNALTRVLGFAYPLGVEAAVRAMVRQYRQAGLV